MVGYQGLEKRQYLRSKVDCLVECRSSKYLQLGRTLNVSLGGVFIVTEQIDSPGTVVELYLEINKQRIQADVTVAWCRLKALMESDRVLPQGMGVKFKKLYGAQAKQIFTRYLAESP